MNCSEVAPMSEIDVCPECDSAQINFRSGSQGGPRGYRCYRCKAEFRRPDRRESYKGSDIPNGTLAKKLWDMDAEEVFG